MKTIQVPFCFHPDAIGGTEVYVGTLAQKLQSAGCLTCIAAPGNKEELYDYQGLKVRRFEISLQINDLKQIYGGGDPLAAQSFGEILDIEKPNLVHLHAFTSAVSLLLVREARQRHIPVVFTYHTPTVSCQRGTLLKWGKQLCDGKLDVHACSRCSLQGLGLNSLVANIVGSLPPHLGIACSHVNLRNKAWTALRTTELVALRQAAFHSLMSEVDHIIAVCDWVKEVLVTNGVSSQCISTIRQGLCYDLPDTLPSKKKTNPGNKLRIAIMGRLHPTKGMHVVIAAVRALPNVPIQLDIYGVGQGVEEDRYRQRLVDLIQGDGRIALKSPLKQHQVISTLATYDLLAVPSQLLETGPMVVLEAFAAGIPVIGSNLGGIAELIHNGVNGVLVEAASEFNWSQELQGIYHNRSKLQSLQNRITPPRKMEKVSDLVFALYKTLI